MDYLQALTHLTHGIKNAIETKDVLYFQNEINLLINCLEYDEVLVSSLFTLRNNFIAWNNCGVSIIKRDYVRLAFLETYARLFRLAFDNQQALLKLNL